MFLVLGELSDPLVEEVLRQLTASDARVCHLTEAELFTLPFAYECGTGIQGFLRLPSGDLRLDDICGVLVRLPRNWWPSLDFDLQDQVFVFHETVAAWFNLLVSLSCPVINRLSLRWWAHDLAYPEELCEQLAAALSLSRSGRTGASTVYGNPMPAAVGLSSSASVYAVGGAALSRNGRDQAVLKLLKEKAPRLARWQVENGVDLCRLDFDPQFGIERVDLVPDLAGEPPLVVTQVAEATIRQLS